VLLTTQQSHELLAKHGVYAREICEKCRAILGAVRFTRKGEAGEWCSRECRDGRDVHPPGTCKGCRASLSGLRRGTKFCSDVCRVREDRKSQPAHISRNTPRKTKVLTDAGIGFGCPYTKTVVNRHFVKTGSTRI
jgi:hypothetical protein